MDDSSGFLGAKMSESLWMSAKIKLQWVAPQLAEKIKTLNEMYKQVNPDDCLSIPQGLRSFKQQKDLWLKGRDNNGTILDPHQIVTDAAPGHSWHEFGLAVDVCPCEFISRPDWEPTNPIWQRLGSMGESLGLVWGGRWHHPDQPHFQLTGKFPVSPTDEVRKIMTDEGISAVWKAAEL